MAIPRLRVEMLGWLQARAGRTIINHFRTRKSATLFSYLAYHCHRSHPREVLAEMLWPDTRAELSRNRLSQALWSMRHELARSGADVSLLLETNHSSVHLNARTDVHDFAAAVEEKGTRSARIASLTRALQVYRGELLPGRYDEWILTERSRLRDLFVTATHELASLLRQEGNPRAAVIAAQRGLHEDPLSEIALCDLMQAQVEMGAPQLALRAYHEAEARLKVELDERPSAQTRELARQIVSVSSSPVSVLEALPAPANEPATTTTAVLVQVGGLTRPWWFSALAQLESEIARSRGQVLRKEPRTLLAGFAHPVDAFDCALRMREMLGRLPCPVDAPLDVRLELDTFVLEPRHGGTAQAAEDVLRFAKDAHAGEIVLSEATAALVRRELGPGLRLRESRGAASAERFYRVVFPGDGETQARTLTGA